VKSKYLSRRAIGLHFAMIFWVALCGLAEWWQVGRAVQGNGLSYMYAIEWPAFGVLGVLGWFALLNTERVTEDEEQARREYEETMRAQALAARNASDEAEDPTMAAYNDHLAKISTQTKKRLWGH
jgi:DNA-binding transcriptional regulator of glucitol operon